MCVFNFHKKYFIELSLGLLVLFFAKPSVAESESTLAEYVRIAIANNPGLNALYGQYQAQTKKVRPAGSFPDPKLTYVRFIESVETRVGPQEHKFGVSQTLPWFGTLSLKSKMAEDNAQAILHRFEGKRLSLIRDVKHTYYDLYFLGRSIGIINQNLDLISNLERVTRSRYRAGIGEFSDVIRSQVELEKLKDQLKTTTDLKTPLTVKFNALLNRSPDTAVPWPKKLSTPTSSYPVEKLREQVKRQNPQLQAFKKEIAREQKRIRLAKKDGLPDFKLGFEYIFTGHANTPIPDSGKDPMSAMITLDLPLWRGKYREQVAEAKSKELSMRKAKEETFNQLISQLAQSLYEYSDTLRKITLYKDNLIPKGRQSFESTKKAYEAGKLSFSDLIDAERLLSEFQLAFENALAKANKAQASIEMLVGQPTPYSDKEENQK